MVAAARSGSRLATSVSPTTVRQDLREVLIRVSDLTNGQPVTDAAVNQKQQHALDTTIGQVSRSWHHATGTSPTPNDIASLLRLIRITTLDVETNGVADLEAVVLLAISIVARPQQAAVTWAILLQKSGELLQLRSRTYHIRHQIALYG